MENDKKERPRNCGECKIYFRDRNNPGRGWCDNWGGVHLHDEDVCHPNRGVKRAKVQNVEAKECNTTTKSAEPTQNERNNHED